VFEVTLAYLGTLTPSHCAPCRSRVSSDAHRVAATRLAGFTQIPAMVRRGAPCRNAGAATVGFSDVRGGRALIIIVPCSMHHREFMLNPPLIGIFAPGDVARSIRREEDD
jgi:hypothetical protein